MIVSLHHPLSHALCSPGPPAEKEEQEDPSPSIMASDHVESQLTDQPQVHDQGGGHTCMIPAPYQKLFLPLLYSEGIQRKRCHF